MEPASYRQNLRIEIGNVKSRILYDGSLWCEYLQNVMLACDAGVSFYVPGYELKPSYLAGTWDGMVHLFNPYPVTQYHLKPFEFYTGLIRKVCDIILKWGYGVEFIDTRVRPETKQHQWNWNEKFTLYDYQEEVRDKAWIAARGLCKLATGAGKTVLGASFIHNTGVAPVIFFVTSQDLMRQSANRFRDIFGVDIGMIGDGLCDIQEINVCTIQTCVEAFGRSDEANRFHKHASDGSRKEKRVDAQKYADIRNLVKSAKLVIFDEVHHAPSETCRLVLEECDSAFYRYGLGATIQREDGMDKVIEALFGEYICDVSASFLIERGHLVAPDIFMIPISEYLGLVKDYEDAYNTYVVNNRLRNDIIVDVATQTILGGMSTLILIKRKKHGAELCEKINKKTTEFFEKYVESEAKGVALPDLSSAGEKMLEEYREKAFVKAVSFIEGSVSGKRREQLISDLDNKVLMGAIATSLADEGLDVTCLECLILCGSGKSATKAMQRIGRVIRIDKNNPKKKAWVFDFIDEKSDVLMEHTRSRLRLYKTERAFRIYDMRKKQEALKAQALL